MLAGFYKKTIKGRLFTRIFVIYTLIVVVILFLMAFSFYRNLLISTEQESIDYNNRVIKETTDYFNQRINIVKTALQGLYLSEKNRENIIKALEQEPALYSIEYSAFKNSIYEYLSSVILYEDSIQDVIVVNCSNNELYAFTKKQRKEKSSIVQDTMVLNNEAKLDFSGVRIIPAFYPYQINPAQPDTASWNQNGVVTVEAFIKNSDSTRLTGILLMNFSLKNCQDHFSALLSKYDTVIMVLTQNGTVIYDSAGKYDKNDAKAMDNLKSAASGTRLLNESLVGIDASTENGIIVVSKVSRKNVYGTISKARNTLVLILVACILSAIISTYFFTSRYARRVDKITRTIDKVESGDLDSRILLKHYDDEMGHIALSFNRMCDNLKTYIDKVYVANLSQKDAELHALQSQINPHFLFNTLEVIRMKAVSKGDDEVGRMIRMLGELFRNSLKKSMIVSLRDELEYCSSLLELYNYRYGGFLHIELDLMEEVLDYGTPRHILQPLIENAILHGIDPDTESARITLSASLAQGVITIRVMDNGKGIEPEKLNGLQKKLEENHEDDGDRIGIFNVNSRLRLIFGDDFGLAIDNTASGGIVTTITLPARTVRELDADLQNHVGG